MSTQPNPATKMLIQDYDVCAYLNALQAYNLNPGTDMMLDQSRKILNAGNYYYLGVPFPSATDCNFQPLENKAGVIQIPPNSYLLSVTGGVTNSTGTGSSGTEIFKVRIFDKGSQSDMIDGQFILGRNFTSEIISAGQDVPRGPHYLLSPFIVVAPGIWQIEIQNLVNFTLPNGGVLSIQVYLEFAVPINTQSLGLQYVESDTGGK